ncbi:MAG: ubiquinone biosynthesis regulatory protein kinase UbiB [Pseudomonadota bacterium]
MRLLRLCYICFILVRYRIDSLLFMIPWLYPFRFLRLLNPFYYWRYRHYSSGKNLRIALERLGPIFVKFGQLLSARYDLLPQDIAEELAKLQDNVQPFSGKVAKKIIEKNLKKSIEELFDQFDSQPLASASIAQVHRAKLKDGSDVVVKVLRPNIRKLIHRDVSLLKTLASLAESVLSGSERIKPLAIIKEFERSLNCELDLMLEAGNATRLRQQFINDDSLYIPEVYWDYCCRNVLVMERISGIPAGKIKLLEQKGINLASAGERLIELFFTQVFKNNFFHADLHPGNIFIADHPSQQPRFILVDFGIIGSLSPEDQRYIAENLLAFFNRDYHRVAELHLASGWLPAQENSHDFATAIRTICEPMFEKPLKDISIGKLLLNIFKIARQFHINIQPQLILLQKNLLHIEALSRRFNPELDLWHTAKPFLENWLSRQVGLRSLFSKTYQNLPYWIEKLPELPDLVYKALQQAGQPVVKSQSTSMLTDENEKSASKRPKRGITMIAGILLVASALNFALAPQAVISAWILFGVGSISLILGLL